MLAVELFSGAGFGDAVGEVVPPVVAASSHGNEISQTPVHDDMLHARAGVVRECVIDGLLQQDLFTAAQAGVTGDDDFRLQVLNACFERFSRKSSKDDGVSNA